LPVVDDQASSAIAEAETAVLAKYNAITEAQKEFKSQKDDMLFCGSLGVLTTTASLVIEEIEVPGRFDLGITEYIDDMYGVTGVAFLGLATHALLKSMKARWKMNH